MKNSLQHLYWIFRYGDTRPAVICSILAGYLWFLSLALPGNTLDRPLYMLMRSIASEEIWMLGFLSLACAQLWRLGTSTSKRLFSIDFILKVVSCAIWTFISIACLMTVYPPAAIVMDTVVIATASWWDFVRFNDSSVNRQTRDHGDNNGTYNSA